jgi:hypothetical protein
MTTPSARARRSFASGRYGWPLAVGAVCVSVWLPIGLTDQSFFLDWANHLWLVSEQTHSMTRLWRPTYFVHTVETGFYYPFYAVYGGSLYGVTAAFALVIDSIPRAYRLTYLGGFLACAFGTWWLARTAGLQRPLAAAVALIPATSAYSITNAYGRGAWPEFMATSMLPLVAAAFVAVVRSPRLRLRDVIPLIGATMILSGSHTITLALSLFFLAVAAVCAAAAFLGNGTARPRVSRLLTASGIAALGVALNGWFVVPLVAYGGATQTAKAMTSASWGGLMPTNIAFSAPSNVLGILPTVPSLSGTPELYVQAPVLPLVWAIAAIVTAVATHRAGPALMRASVASGVLAVIFLALALWPQLWTGALSWMQVTQYTYRIETYATLAVTAVVACGALAVASARHRTWWLASLAAVMLFHVGWAEWHSWGAQRYGKIAVSLAHNGHAVPTFYGIYDYRFPGGKHVTPASLMGFAPASVQDDRLSVTVARTALPAMATVDYSPLVRATGELEVVGTKDTNVVVGARAPGPTKFVTGVFAPAYPAPVIAGIALSLIASAGVALLLATVFARNLRRRRTLPDRGAPAESP